jgi:hypothetical protein
MSGVGFYQQIMEPSVRLEHRTIMGYRLLPYHDQVGACHQALDLEAHHINLMTNIYISRKAVDDLWMHMLLVTYI